MIEQIIVEVEDVAISMMKKKDEDENESVKFDDFSMINSIINESAEKSQFARNFEDHC